MASARTTGIAVGNHDPSVQTHFASDGVGHGTAVAPTQAKDTYRAIPGDIAGNSTATGSQPSGSVDLGNYDGTEIYGTPVSGAANPTWFIPSLGIDVGKNAQGQFDANIYGTSPQQNQATNWKGSLGDALSAAGVPIPGLSGTPGSGSSSSSSAGSSSSPFSQLTSLLGNLAGQTPSVSIPDTSTAAQAVPTQNGPSMVLPLVLLVLAAAAGYWYYTKHKHAHGGGGE